MGEVAIPNAISQTFLKKENVLQRRNAPEIMRLSMKLQIKSSVKTKQIMDTHVSWNLSMEGDVWIGVC
jgi:hypothetical protein